MTDLRRIRISGRAIPLRGDDIDTDRIIPARYLKCVTFDGLGEHAFEDDRKQERERGRTHPFDNPAYADAEILLVNRNFGCGSSREHAPQSILRWGRGIKAIVGESFAEIFFGNCVALGIPCVTVNGETAQQVMAVAEGQPERVFTLDLEHCLFSWEGGQVPVLVPEGPRHQFLEGRWDSTAELLAARDAIAVVAARLPYFAHWK